MTGTAEPAPALPDGELVGLLLDSVADFAIITQDVGGIVTSWNRGAECLLGWTEEQAVGASGDMIFTEEQRDRGVPEMERQTASDEGRAEDERWHQRQDGSRFWGSGLMMPLAEPGTGFIKIFRDRTRQHEAETLLAESEARFRLLATNIPQLVFRSRGSGSRIWGSPQWEVFTGLSLEQSVEFGWLDAIHPSDRDETRAAWGTAQRTREYYVEHRIRRHPDGTYRWHQTRAKPVVDQLGDDWVGTSADIHELRTLKDRQQILMAELQHRTRNLLAVVQAIARQTARGADDLEAFSLAFESRLRALSRVQGLIAEVDHGDVPLEQIVRLELEAHGDGEAPANVQSGGPSVMLPPVSAQALALALHELATNAVKYGALSQPAANLSVGWRIDMEKGGDRVTLDWVESGVAMPPKRERRGYGSELIERALPYQLMATTRLEFGPEGVCCSITVPLSSQEVVADGD